MDLDGFFKPKSIAIVGASRKEGSLGRAFIDRLINYRYTGEIFPVNPQASEIRGIPSYESVEKIPVIPELAVILVKKELALDAVEACGRKGIKKLVMVTAGFREVGGEGVKREKQLLKIVKKYGLRIIGPNCMGIINTDPEVRMNASFSPTDPLAGNVAFISQSGALGVAVLEMSKAMNLGFSIFVSEGNKADLEDSDFLEYLSRHEKTDVIALYLESIEDTSRFRKIATLLSHRKPIIALKAGSSVGGAKAAASHTGALSSPDRATDALFRQSGILRVHTLPEMFNVSLAFSSQPIPRGNRIAVITNAGGPGILASDAIERYGLEMAQLDSKTGQALRVFLPEEASTSNPVDMIASASEQTYRQTLELVLRDPGVDAVLVIIVRPPVSTTPEMIAKGFTDLVMKANIKPIFVSLMADRDETCGLPVFRDFKLPVYSDPAAAVHSMAAMLKYQEWRKKPAGKTRKFTVTRGNLQHIFEGAAAENRKFLRTNEIFSLLEAYQLPAAQGKIVQSPEEAIEIAREFKVPVVLKIEADQIVHKSDSGCVKVNLNSPDQIRQAFQQIMENALKITPPHGISGILVQEMVQGIREIAMGMNRDPNYGPMIMFGMGGIFIEVFNDISFRIAPLTEGDAREMISEIRGYPLLKAFRGMPEVNLNLAVESLLKLSQLSLDWPQIEEIDFNPFMMAPEPENCKIVDTRIKINLKK